jgi:hypothetical protein
MRSAYLSDNYEILYCNFCVLSYYLMFVLATLCVLIYCVCIAVLHTVVTGLLNRSQYLEGPATGHLGTGCSWFPCV